MVVIYYIKLLRMPADGQNDILMSLLLVVKTMNDYLVFVNFLTKTGC